MTVFRRNGQPRTKREKKVAYWAAREQREAIDRVLGEIIMEGMGVPNDDPRVRDRMLAHRIARALEGEQ